MIVYTDALALVVLTAVVIIAVILLGIAMWIYARAVAEVARAWSHHISAAEQLQTAKVANQAIDDINATRSFRRPYTPPPEDDEVKAAVRAGRQSQGETGEYDRSQRPEPEVSTTRNEMRSDEDQPLIPADQLYVREE